MKKFFGLAAAALAFGLMMAPEDASARWRGGGFRMGGFHGGGFRGFHGGFRGFHHGGFRGFHGGFRPVAFHRGFHHGGFHRPFAFRHAAWRSGWGHRRHWGGWGYGAGALAAGALIGAAAASSYYPYDYGYGYGGGYYPASYGACYQTLQWVQTPYGWQRAWVTAC
jgi:hypothetical protein